MAQESKINPYSELSEEEKALAERHRALMDQLPNNLDNKVTDENYAKLYFVRYQYMAIILDALASQKSLSWKELNQIIHHNLPKRIVEKVPFAMGMVILKKMFALDYINIKETEKNYFECSITSLGLQVVQNLSIHNMAATTFFSYQTQRLNKIVVAISITATIVAVISMAIAFIALK